MEPTQSGVNPWGEAVNEAMQKRLASLDSPKYRANTKTALVDCASFLATERDVTDLQHISTLDCRRYSQRLRERVRDDDKQFSASTADQYFSYVRAWLEWCVRDERLDTNPAKPDRAQEPLPEDTSEADRQYWSKRQRTAICITADKRVEAHFDDEDLDREQVYRDRALVYVLAYSGCRGAELVRESADEDRPGIAWDDVDFGRGLIRVLGKSRDIEHAPLLEPAHEPLQKWKQIQDPTPETHVFPRLDPVARRSEAPADSITTESLRQVLRTLCDWSGYEFGEYLKPHGARRGLGDELYSESPVAAQELLRHNDIGTTHEAYREGKAERVREQAEDILFDDSD